MGRSALFTGDEEQFWKTVPQDALIPSKRASTAAARRGTRTHGKRSG